MPEPHQNADHLFVYENGNTYERAIGLRGTDHNRYQKSGGTAGCWLRLRGDTVNLRGNPGA